MLFSLLGRARATGRRDVALALGEELRKAYPDASYRPRLLLLLGDMYAETKQPQLALAAYLEAAAKPGVPEALRGRLLAGKVYQTELRDYAAALAEYAAVDKKGLSAEDRESLLLYEADCVLRMGDFERTAAILDELALASPGEAGKERVAFEKSELLFYQGKVPEAAAEYLALTSSFPAGRLVDDAIDRIFLLQENSEGGGDLLQRFGEAEYRARVGDSDGAVARLQKMVTENPEAPILDDARFRVAAILAEAGRSIEGAQAFHALATDMPKSKYAPRAFRRAGDLWRAAGKPEEAVREYQALLTQYPQSLDAEEVRGTAEDLRRKIGS
jgi:TolA-binding protein